MKTRIISAIVMLAIVVPIFVIGGIPFKILGIVLAIASMYEMLKARSSKSKIPLLIRILSYIFIACFVYLGTDVYSANYELIYKIMTSLFLIYFIPVVLINNTEKYSVTDALYVLGSSLFLGIAFNSFILISNNSMLYIIYLALITVITDTFAYFTGYFIGKNKMCEDISPKKTWEGAIGGTLIGTIIPVLFYMFFINQTDSIYLLIGVTLFLSIIGQIGDLFFSSVKRHYKIKDFSNLIPGHGGILDRLDSIIFVVLAFVLFIEIL